MTKKRYSSAKKQYEIYDEFTTTMSIELNKGVASFFLMLPIPMTYEVWQHLHKVKGDLE